MKNIVSASMLAATLSWSVTASATLIDRGNGMIYDSNQNLTWLQDTNYAKTSGYDDDGLMSWGDAMAWAANLSYGGHDNWRLPKVNIQYPYPIGFDGGGIYLNWDDEGMFLISGSALPWLGEGFIILISGSEIASALGETMSVCTPSFVLEFTEPITVTCTTGSPSPFMNIGSSPFWFGIEQGDSAWAGMGYGDILANLHPKPDQLQAWAVRDVDVAAIPEPHSVALVALGLACMGYSMRKSPGLQRNRD